MSTPDYFDGPDGRKLAYHLTPGRGPWIVFLGGLKSDMEGTKALHLEAWAKAQGRAFLRFDYSGHGLSSGTFEQGCIGDWAEDSFQIVQSLTEGQILPIGSSMGGWQALLLAKRIPDRIIGMLTIAAAPDFTEDGYWDTFSPEQKAELRDKGQVEIPSDYMEPYVVTSRMIEDGRKQLVLRDRLDLPFPVRCVQGTADSAVSTQTALRLMDHATCPDMRLTLVKDADHRFSDGPCLGIIEGAVQEILALAQEG